MLHEIEKKKLIEYIEDTEEKKDQKITCLSEDLENQY